MIMSAIFGLVMNVLMVDNATGQNLTRAFLFHTRIENIERHDLKEEKKQLAKDIIIGVKNDT